MAVPAAVLRSGQPHTACRTHPLLCGIAVPAAPVHRRQHHAARPRFGGCGRVAVQAAKVTASAEQKQDQDKQWSVELPSSDMRGAVTLTRLRAGPGYAIVVASVQPGSAALAAGVRPGQQLLQVSDPIRPNEMWSLNENSSLRHVRQAVRMRVPETITLHLSAQPIPEWGPHLAASRAAAAAAAAPQQQPAERAQPDDAAASGASMDAPDDLLTAIVQAAASGDSFDAGEPAAAGAAPTVAQQLEQRYREAREGSDEEGSAARQALTALEKRQQRRKEYFQQASERNDAPFFAGVAALFILPPAAILLYAFATGYIYTLDAYGALR